MYRCTSIPFFSIACRLCKSRVTLSRRMPDLVEGMSKLKETSSLVLSDFKRINQGLPVLFLLQTSYHSYTKHYWRRMPAHFPCVCSYSVSDTVTFWMEAYLSLARYVQFVLYSGCQWLGRYALVLSSWLYCCCRVFPLFTPACGFIIPQNVCFCSAKPYCWQKRWCFLAMACCGRGGLQNGFKAVRSAQ